MTSAWTPPAPAAAATFWVRVSNPLVSAASEGAEVTVAQGSLAYADWALGLPAGQRDPQADPLGCGMPNALPFALGLDAIQRPG